jgi:hypothetical protein
MAQFRVVFVLSLTVVLLSSVNNGVAAPNINSGGVNDALTGAYPPTAFRYWSIYGTGLAQSSGPPFSGGSDVPTAQTFFQSCSGQNQQSYNTQTCGGGGCYWYESPLQINFWAVSGCSSGSNKTGRVLSCISSSCDFEDIIFNQP